FGSGIHVLGYATGARDGAARRCATAAHRNPRRPGEQGDRAMSVLPPTISDLTATVIRLRCGTLTLHVESAVMPLDELCIFGSRGNRKRGFLFISKVLGKHVPVRPSLMQRIHELLAGQIADVRGPAVVIALAETATGLGQGVFEAHLRQSKRDDAMF